MLSFGTPFILALLNRYRGSGKKFSMPIVFAVIFGIIYLLTFNLYAAIGATIAYGIGESFGWGKWLITVPHWGDDSWQATFNKTLAARDDGQSIGIHQLANAVANQEKDFTKYSQIALVLRGFVWWAPFYAVLVFLAGVSVVPALGAVVMLSVGFPILYWLGTKFPVIRLPFFEGTDYWSNGEYFYGALQGIGLILVFGL